MPISENQKKLKARRAKLAIKNRLVKIARALDIERARFNRAIAQGKQVVLKTDSGPYVVDKVDYNFDYHTHPMGTALDQNNTQLFCGFNDKTWADLLKQAGIRRHPTVVRYTSYKKEI